MGYTSKAINKFKRDGLVSLIISGPSYISRRVKNAYQIYINPDVRQPKKKIYVNPSEVEYYRPSLFPGSYKENFGKVKSGDWDKERYLIKNHPKYKACEQRVEGKSWEETGIVDYMMSQLEEKDVVEDGCESRKDILRLYNGQREKLFQSMKTNGYNEEVSNVCCRVHIGRSGELILASGGRHRLFFAKILGINEVPVRVLWRHQQWQSMREEINRTKRYNDLSEKAKNHVSHPDLQEFVPDHWPST